jgi:ComF family protein
LQRLKFGGDLGIGEVLARRLWGLLQTLPWTPEAVAPVPISRSRRAERGYNQAGWIAGPLAWLSGIPYQPNCLQKPREIRSQVGLTMAERRANVQDAYRAVPNQVAGQRILLIDDITTTGATLDACAQALLDAGAIQVWALTAARVLRPGDASIPPTI